MKLLVIDDEKGYCDSLQLILSGQGHEVLATRDARDGMAIGVAHKPDVLITDWLLRDNLTGTEIAAELRRHNPGMKSIMLSGCSELKSSDDKVRGFDGFIAKPFRIDEILKAVAALGHA